MFNYPLGQYSLIRWTPYAEAIASHYDSVTQFFLNVPTTLTGVADERKTVSVPAHEFDRLIFGAHVQACVDSGTEGEDIITEDAADDVVTEDAEQVITEGGGEMMSNCGGQQVYLQVSDDRTGIKWATVSPIDAAPMSAYGGSSESVMPLILLPEPFFLPKGVDLRHDFKVLNDTMDGGRITWVGVQLAEGKAPDFVDVPRLGTVKTGSRIPWLAVIGLGRRVQTGDAFYSFVTGRRVIGYTQPAEYDVEISDIHGQFALQADDLGVDPDEIQFSLSNTGQRQLWSQTWTPSRNFLGDTTKAFPVQPLPQPFILKAGDQLELSIFNNQGLDGETIVDGFVVIRGTLRGEL